MPYSKRTLNILGFLAVTALLLMGFYLEYVEGMLPCPLCMVQRLFFFLIGVVFLVAVLRKLGKIGQRVCGGAIFIFALGGASAAIRQLWVQTHSQTLSEICMPGIQYMMTNFPFERALGLLLSGLGDCSEVSWRFLGLSLAGWALIAFISFAFLGLYQMLFAK
ncbi:MAG: disulfide bond formation protein [Gammaproteobacteria bacterium]|jgi:disulfide bond formation protein DsbB|nr:disulfide bond formation protein [Gammaproteobacteria bacterium]